MPVFSALVVLNLEAHEALTFSRLLEEDAEPVIAAQRHGFEAALPPGRAAAHLNWQQVRLEQPDGGSNRWILSWDMPRNPASHSRAP